MSTPPAPVAVRAAAEDDAEAVAALVAEALGDKYRPALGAGAQAAIAALVRRDVAGPGTNRRWVAEIDGRVAGSVTMSLGRDADEGFPAAVAEAVGWPRAIRATLVLSLLGHGQLDADEAYIDELAVADWARRRGVGRALLETCAVEAAEAGRRRLTLWVTVGNVAGRALYARAGFGERRRRRVLAGRLLFRAPGAILMERRLAPAPPAQGAAPGSPG
ncbi:MAG: GNAT family N-acetyltransferase [Thermoleophilia bacterium]|nr:GNAT family N-acetyltransferase [Thermoleophilia bacterium]